MQKYYTCSYATGMLVVSLNGEHGTLVVVTPAG
jgi:hypothetical protein